MAVQRSSRLWDSKSSCISFALEVSSRAQMSHAEQCAEMSHEEQCAEMSCAEQRVQMSRAELCAQMSHEELCAQMSHEEQCAQMSHEELCAQMSHEELCAQMSHEEQCAQMSRAELRHLAQFSLGDRPVRRFYTRSCGGKVGLSFFTQPSQCNLAGEYRVADKASVRQANGTTQYPPWVSPAQLPTGW